MNENFDVRTPSIEDTTPEITGEDTQSIERNNEGIVTPDNNNFIEQDVMRDTDANLA